MAVISLDRYRGISTPFKARNTTHFEVAIKIVLIWAATAIVSSPIGVMAVVEPAALYSGCHCGIFPNFRVPAFQIYGTVLAFLLPCTVMAVTYIKTVLLLRKQMQMALGANPTLRRNTGATPSRSGLIMSAMDMVENPDDAVAGLVNMQTINRVFYDIMMKRRKKHRVTRKMGIGRPSMKHNMKKAAVAYYLMSRKDSKALVKKEKKATSVLGIVFASFFGCWAPFFITNLVLALCGIHCSRFPPALASTFLWLGYVSSVLNPLIYTTFNRTYRETFVNILCFRFEALMRQRSRRHRSAQSGQLQLKEMKPLKSTTIVSRTNRRMTDVEL